MLSRDVCEEHPWETPQDAIVHLLVDAAGEPSRCAAVLFVDGRIIYTDGAPSKAITNRLAKRADSQIMALESLAIGLGLCTFASELQGRKVVVYSDNTGAEAAVRQGSAKSWDHCEIVHDIWSLALMNRTFIWVERVCSKENLSDCPSRLDYELLQQLGAEWRAPVMVQSFVDGFS